MKKRRLLAWLMTLVMMIGLMPATALAEGEAGTPAAPTADLEPDPVPVERDGETLATLSKTAVDKGDGTYDITLSVTASEAIESQPVEIVLVLDSSGSMAWCTSDKELHEHSWNNGCYTLTCTKVESFFGHHHNKDCYELTCPKDEHTHVGGGVECQIVENGADSRMEVVKEKAIGMLSDIADIGGNVKIAVVDFDSSASTACGLTPVTEDNIAENGPIVEAINGMEAEGGTQPARGLTEAAGILSRGDTYAKKVVILLADGDADSTNAATSAVNQATTMKNAGVEIFTIGFKTDADMLEEIATDAKHYATADSATDLEAIFDTIVKGLAAMILDPMGGFVNLQGGEDGIEVTLGGDTYSEGLEVTEEEQIEWNKQGGLTKNQTVTLEYTVALDEKEFLKENAGVHEVPLNGAAKLNYSYKNEGGQAYFPVPTATVSSGQLVEKYYVDGELVETVEADKVIIRDGVTFTWAADPSVLDEEVKYVESRHGETVVDAAGSVAATAGEYVIEHHYTTDLEATLYVNAQDKNGTLIEIVGLTDTVHKVVNSYDISADYPGTITVGEDTYIFDGVIEGKLSDTVTKDGQTFLVILQYTKDYWADEKTVTFTFDANGGAWTEAVSGYEMGEGNVTASKEVEFMGSVSLIPAEPVRDGYEFMGWYSKNSDGELTGKWWHREDVTYTVVEDQTVYAMWKEIPQDPPAEELKGTLYVNAQDENGTYIEIKGLTDKEHEVVSSYDISKDYPGTITVGEDTYIFDGVIEGKLSDTVTKDGQTFIVILQYTKDYWADEKAVTFTFDANGGAWTEAVSGYEMGEGNVTASKEVEFMGSVSLIPAEPVRDGYEFMGWYSKNSDGELTGKWWHREDVTYTVVEDQTVYAMWKEIPQDPPAEELKGTLYVNAQDENGTYIEIEGLTDTTHEVEGSYDISADYPGTITVGEDTYIFDGVIEGKLSDTVTKDGQTFIVILKYSKVDIDIEKEVDGDKSIKRGQWVRYEITVKNTGEFDLTNVVVTETPDKDQFQKGYFINDDGDEIKADYVTDGRYTDTYTINKLAVGDKVTLNYKAQVADDATRGKYLINNVAVTSKEGAEASDENNDAYVPKKSSGGGSSSKKDKEIVAGDVEEILNTEDHFQYVQGYPDGTVGPERNITRAEATVIFFRLLQDHVRAELLTAENNFPDVNLDDWFNLGVSTMEYGDFVSGYEDGTFRPNGNIIRAELATIISNFDDLEPVTENRFPDVEGHWAEAYINSAAEKGWLSGYDDGLYRPNQYITRAETMSMINRVLNRRVDAEGLRKDAKQWVDNTEDKWYYYAVLEATNHHDYQRADVKDMENWTAINPNKIWEN